LKYKYTKISLERICRLFGITRQACYQYFQQEERIRVEQRIVLEEIKSIRHNHKSMGTRKLHYLISPFLIDNNIKMGRDALFHLLAEENLLIKNHRRRVTTTMSYHRYHRWPNLIKDIVPMRPIEVYVSDITYWRINTGYVYISLVTDAYSHKIVGYNVAKTLEAKESITALEQALSEPLIGKAGQIIHHSDRGIQYCCNEYVKLLQDNNILISMTENGDPRDNAIAERVNGILKNEYLTHYQINNIEEAKVALDKAVCLYNNERPHLSINYLTPDYVHATSCRTKRQWKNYYKKRESVNVF
jgi:putative transposase